MRRSPCQASHANELSPALMHGGAQNLESETVDNLKPPHDGEVVPQLRPKALWSPVVRDSSRQFIAPVANNKANNRHHG